MAARIVSPKQLGAIPFVSGEGLKVYAVPTDAPWYGSGYCSICGGEPFPARVRYWDPDDGWRSGVLCVGCADECAERGPRADDYAVMATQERERARHMDTIAAYSAGDDDAAHVDSNELA